MPKEESIPSLQAPGKGCDFDSKGVQPQKQTQPSDCSADGGTPSSPECLAFQNCDAHSGTQQPELSEINLNKIKQNLNVDSLVALPICHILSSSMWLVAAILDNVDI